MGYNGSMEREPHASPEEIILNLIDRLEISEGINYEFYQRGPWWKQYGNTSDPDGEYEIKLNDGSINLANEAKKALLEFGNKQPEFLGQILTDLLNKKIPSEEPLYVLSRTETGFQMVTPEPSDEHGWTWVSGPESRKMIEDTVLSFGLKAIPHLEAINSKKAHNLTVKIKRQELARKVKRIFIRS
jgi:hypothetical protein